MKINSHQLSTVRAKAIADMQDALALAKPADLPGWLITLIVSLVFAREAVRLTCRLLLGSLVMVLHLTICIATVPFIAVFYWADLLLVMHWFFKQVARRMHNKEQEE